MKSIWFCWGNFGWKTMLVSDVRNCIKTKLFDLKERWNEILNSNKILPSNNGWQKYTQKSPLASRYLIHIFLLKKKKTETITISFDLNQITNFIYETGVEWALILKFHIFGRYMDFYFIVINGSNPTIKSISCILMLFWYNNIKIIVSTEH